MSSATDNVSNDDDVEMTSPPAQASKNKDNTCSSSVLVEKTKWPDSLPHPEAGFVLSVVCGNTRFHWALHEADGFFPCVFWKLQAPAAKSKKKQGNDDDDGDAAAPPAFAPATVQNFFRKYFPDKVLRRMMEEEKFVDEKENLTQKEVFDKFSACFALRRTPFLTIYVLSTNDAGLQDLKHLVSKLPVRLHQMQAQDFFAPHLHYPGMGVDRLAALCAAEQLYGGPSLVIDGGTATTFTATAITEQATAVNGADDSSTSAVWNTVRVRGGGIGPGIRSKFSVMHSHTSALPYFATSQVREYVDQLKRGEKQPLSVLDAPDTKQAMMGTVFRETASHLQSVVATWAQETLASPSYIANKQKAPARRVGTSGDQDTDDDNSKTRLCDQPVGEAGHQVNRDMTVLLTGGDGDLFMDLLNPVEGEGRILHPDTVLPALPCPVNFMHQKYLVQQGISKVLVKQWQRFKGQTTGNELKNAVVGQRVVKRMTRRGSAFSMSTRGTVVSAHSTNYIYQIIYDDDGKRDEMNGEELYDALLLYAKEGEKPGKDDDDDDDLEEKRRAKRTGANDASKLLEQCVPALVARMEQRLAQERKTAAAAAAAATTTAGKRTHAEQEAATTTTTTCRYATSSSTVESSSKRARSSEGDGPAPPAEGGAADAAAGPQAEAEVAAAPDNNNGPAPPPPPPVLPPTQESLAENPLSYIGVRMAKSFNSVIYFGDVDEYDATTETEGGLWKIVYDDGDQEDYDAGEMEFYYNVYQSNKESDPKSQNKK